MADSEAGPVRGVLRTPGDGGFTMDRLDPTPALAAYVAWHWSVRWDRRGLEPHHQVTLPHPAAHVVVEVDGAWLYGPLRRRFERTLTGVGGAVGVHFRPGAVRPLLGRPVAAITDRRLPVATLPGLDGEALARDVRAAADLGAARVVVEAALARLLPATPDPAMALAERAVALPAEDRSVARVPDLADRLGLSVRSLQRLFADWVGVGPAWVIRRHRLHEAAARATAGAPVDWARLAAELGYYDQAHLVRDFTATIGTAPARYAAAG